MLRRKAPSLLLHIAIIHLFFSSEAFGDTQIDVREDLPYNTTVYDGRSLFPSSIGVDSYEIDGDDDGNGFIAWQSTFFTIDRQSGIIRLASNTSLDYEDSRLRLIRLYVIGNRERAKQSYGETLTIRLVDVNDNPPRFRRQFYRGFIRENVHYENVSGIPYFTALDNDSPSHGVRSYRVLPDEGGEWFEALTIWPDGADSPYTVLRTINKTLDRERNGSVYVTVEAIDAGNLTATVTVEITVIDDNDNVPRFTDASKGPFNVSELASVGETVFQVEADDLDIGVNGLVYYSIEKSGDFFSCHPGLGVVSVAQSLDYESAPTHRLVIVARDRGNPSLSASVSVTVAVLNANEFPPVFLGQQSINVNENAPVMSSLSPVLSLSDADAVDGEEITVDLVSGDPDGYFKIGVLKKVNGDFTFPVVTNRRFDEDASRPSVFNLTLLAQDGGSPPLSSKFHVTVNITESKSPPAFTKRVYEAEISEEMPTGSQVTWAKAIDNDEGLGGSLTFTKRNGDTLEKFRVYKQTGLIVVHNHLDRETRSFYNLTVTVSDGSGLTDTAQVLIHVLDVNDHSPTFLKELYVFDVSEDEKIGTSFAAVTATDADIGTNSELHYTIVKSTVPGALSVNEFNGALVAAKSLDYEGSTVKSIGVVVQCEDRGLPFRRSVTTHVIVNIQNANDNPPQFAPSQYTCIVQENGNGGDLCTELAVQDRDGLSMGTMAFSIVGGNNQSRFSVDGNGELVTTGILDREESDSYVLTVSVSDGVNAGSNEAVVTVIVGDKNDNPPEFEKRFYDVLVEANAPDDHVVATVKASTRDIGPESLVAYFFNRSADPFYIDPYSGEIRRNGKLGIKVHNVTVVAENAAGSSVAYLSFFVVDGNFPPGFTAGPTDRRVVSSDAAVGSEVATVVTQDVEGDKVSYTLAQPSTAFSLQSNGSIRVASQLKGNVEYQLEINATDSGFPAKSTIQKLTIFSYEPDTSSQPNNRPQFKRSHYVTTVSEGGGLGQSVVTVSASDADVSSSALAYSIVSVEPSSGQSLFRINSNGLVELNLTLDREISPVYFMAVKASDGSLSSQCSITVSVRDIDDMFPLLAESGTVYIPENIPSGSRVYKVENLETDDPQNADVTFSFTQPFSLFKIDMKLGYITVEGKIDLESPNFPYAISVRASNDQRSSSPLLLTLVYEDVNDHPPVFGQSTYSVPVLETVQPDMSIERLTATDKDSNKTTNGAVSYEIIKGNKGGAFFIEPDTGVLSPQLSLDYESVQTYELVVQARDHGINPLTATATVYITVKNTNNFRPAFLLPAFSVNIQIPASTSQPVAQMMAVNGDGQVDAVDYKLINSNGFTISDSGLVFPPSSWTAGRFTLTVQATDKVPVIAARKSDTVELVVIVAGPNTGPSLRSINQMDLKESALLGKPLTDVSSYATDPDGGYAGQLLFSISGNEDAKFEMNPFTGELSLQSSLDRETMAKYDLTVLVTDYGVPRRSATTALMIVVSDVNDNPPIFSSGIPTVLTVKENSGVGTVLASRLDVSDADTGINADVRFRLTNDILSRFKVDEMSGNITVNGTLDRETKSFYELHIDAYDQGSPSLSSSVVIRIDIADVPDTRPQCFQQHVKVEIPEDHPKGVVLSDLGCVDLDKGRLYYLLSTGNTTLWNVSDSTGAVQLIMSVSYLSDKELNLSVQVQNFAARHLSVTVNVTVVVTRVERNFHWPVFSSVTPYPAEISEASAVGSLVTTVSAYDGDTGPEGEVHYLVVGGTGAGKFSLNSFKGEIRTAVQLDYEEVAEYFLSIAAVDGGSSPKSSVLLLTISVLNVNDNSPYFQRSSYAVTANEISISGLFVAITAAVDADSPSLSYSISQGKDSNDFIIDNQTGLVVSGKNGLTRDFYNPIKVIWVKANDSSLVSTAQVFVTLTDIDNNGPFFQTPNPYDVVTYSTIPADWPIVRVVAWDEDSGPDAVISYKLDGTPQVPFKIDPSSGVVNWTSSAVLTPAATFALRVAAESGGDSLLKETSDLTIKIRGVQRKKRAANSKPSFSSPNLTISVPENFSVGAILPANVSASDADDSLVIYKVVPEPGSSDILSVHPNSGELRLVEPLDRETQSVHYFNVTAFDGKDFSYASLSLIVVDVNDNWPEFNETVISASVLENVGIGTPVALVSAFDPDEGSNGNLVFSIANDSGLNEQIPFRISQNGSLSVAGLVDREASKRWVLSVCASDQGSTPKQNCVQVRIDVLDVNDNSPDFGISTLTTDVPENTLPGFVVLTASAGDADIGTNGLVRYSLSGSVPFAVNQTTGQLSVFGALDYESVTAYNFSMVATDLGNPSRNGSLNIVVNIGNLPDSGPLWSQSGYKGQVTENGAVGLPLTMVSASSDGPVLYRLLRDPCDCLQIDSFTGLVSTSKALDREYLPTFNVSLESCDVGRRCNDVNLTVVVLDENDNSPKFIPVGRILLNVSESTKQADEVYTFSVFDSDEGENAEVTLTFLDPAPTQFALDSSTGRLTLQESLDRESVSTVSFRVEARDHGRPKLQTTADVLVTVIDVNDNIPRFLLLTYSATITSPLPLDATVVRITATDADIGMNGQISYSIASGNDDGKLAVNSTSGEVFLRQNYDLKPQYNLRVTVTDGGDLSSQASVVINVNIKPGSVQFLPSSHVVVIKENLPANTSVVNVSAVDFLQTAGSSDSVRYSIVSPSASFVVNPITGSIVTSTTLDREDESFHHLVVEAVAVSDPFRLAHATVDVKVLDVNDNTPKFEKNRYQETVKEDTETGKDIFRVKAVDRDDGLNAEVTYSVVSSTSQKFAIDPKLGIVRTSGSLLGSVSQSFTETLVVRATDGGTPPRNNTAVLVISVVDVDAPQFNATDFSVSVAENVNQGTFVTQLLVSFNPSPRQLKYTVETGDDNQRFLLDSNSGRLTVAGGINYENVPFYSLTIRATDPGATPLYAQVVLNVTVLDVNDNDPIFGQNLYVTSKKENVGLGVDLLNVSANDADSGAFGAVRYSLDPTSDTFDVDPMSGAITVAKSLDADSLKEYRLTAIASDGGNPPRSSSAAIRIIPINVNDNAPQFPSSPIIVQVDEKASKGATIGTIQATDDDGDSVTYSIVVDEADRRFALDRKTGSLRLSPDREPDLVRPEFRLVVSASDGKFNSSANLTVVVNDNNDHRPAFNQSVYDGHVMEGSASGTFVTQVFATDDDFGTNGQIKYEFVGQSSEFSIDPKTGRVSTSINSLDREKVPIFNLKVTALDGGGDAGFADLVITIGDVNDNDPIFQVCGGNQKCQFTVNVQESAKRDDVVDTLSVTDRDAGRNAAVTFNVSQSSIVNPPLLVDPVSGHLVAKRDLRQEGGTKFDLTVQAVDGGVPSRTGSVVLLINVVIEANSPPQFVKPFYQATVKELAVAGTNVTVVCAGDRSQTGQNVMCPSNRTVHYGILSNGISYFAVDQLSGVVTVADGRSVPDIFIAKKHSVIIYAQYADNFRFQGFASLDINVSDINNNNPTFDSLLYSGKIAENNAVGAVVLKVEATDADEGTNGVVRYFVSADTPVPFVIDSVSGVVSATAVLDFETQEDYVFKIYAEDLGSPQKRRSDERTVVIDVDDENDNPPIFDSPSYTTNIEENAQVPSSVISVSAQDADKISKNKLTYSINSGNDQGSFEIKSTGEIVVAKSLDRERKHVYRMNVSVFDGLFTSSTSVTVNLDDINDVAPELELISDERIFENVANSTFVVQVSATDEDIGANKIIRYSLSGQRPAEAFRIDPVSGEIFVNSTLDYESVPRYSLDVVAFNPNDRSMRDVASFRVNVLDVNDNAPTFLASSLSVSVLENSIVPSDVGQVVAEDRDSGTNGEVIYTVLDDVNGTFFVDGGGRITAEKTLDREANASYVLHIKASDGGSPSLSSTAQVTVSVTDINDSPPVFTLSSYQVNISEDHSLQTTAAVVLATDADAGTNSEVQYSIVNPNRFPNFRLDSKTGAISLMQRLDFEDAKSYELYVRADDGGFPVLSGTALVVVNVTDVNDNAPRFFGTPYRGEVKEDVAVGTVVFALTANDRDSSSNAELHFDIIRGNVGREFMVNSSTREILTAGPLDRETRDDYSLVVEVRDGGVPALSATADIKISVNDVNDNFPVFQPPLHGNVLENRPVVKGIVVLSATDEDIGVNKDVTFKVENGGFGGLFVLMQGNRLETNGSSFDRELQKEYAVNVSATDGGVPALTTYVIIRVTIDDENDNEPIAFHRTLLLNYFAGKYNGGEIGRVGILDPDDDDQLSYAVLNADGTNFEVNVSTGALISPANPRAGHYNLTVSASWSDQVLSQHVEVIVIDVTSGMISSGVTVRLERSRPEDFLSYHYGTFVKVIAEVLKVAPADVIVLSIQSTAKTGIDIVFAVHRSLSISTLYDHREFVQSEIMLRKGYIEDKLGLTIESVAMDLCAPEPCSNSGYCSNNFALGSSYDGVSVQPIWFYSLRQSRDFTCQCLPGFEGDDCGDGAYDYCFSSPCLNEGNCTNLPDRFHCDCPANVSGQTCQRKTEFCTSNPCLNDGTCVERLRTFSCQCPSGFTGPKCEQQLFSGDLCLSTTDCRGNQGNCTSGPSGFTCTCPPGKAGLLCENTTSLQGNVTCDQNPCLYGGTCRTLENSTFQCECSIGFVGDRCQTDVNECDPNLCRNGGICQNGHGGYRCNCRERYQGLNCETDLTVCRNLPCKANQHCVTEPNSDSYDCVSLCDPNPCLHGGACVQVRDTITCECPFGFDGNRCELTGVSFGHDSFIMFPAVDRRRNGSIKFEFVTDEPDGLLLFNGRYDLRYNDFIAVELSDGRVKVSYTVGVDVVAVAVKKDGEKPTRLDDRQWHSVEIQWEGAKINLTLDDCSHPIVKTTGQIDVLDTSNCQAEGIALGNDSSLDLDAPFFLGGLEAYNITYPVVQRSFSGCIRNVYVGRSSGQLELLDMLSPLKKRNLTGNGCPVMENGCRQTPPPCGSNAVCAEAWNSQACNCKLGHEGDQCNQNRSGFTLDGKSYVEYTPRNLAELSSVSLSTLRRRRRENVLELYEDTIAVRLRTRKANNTRMTVFVTAGQEGDIETLEVENGIMRFIFYLGGGIGVVAARSVPVTDGGWHDVVVVRRGNKATLTVDGSGEATGQSQVTHQLLRLSDGMRFYVGGKASSSGKDSFEGCIQDVQFNDIKMPGLDGDNLFEVTTRGEGSPQPGCARVDVCASNPCLLNHDCHDLWNFFSCVPLPCSEMVCVNNGTCRGPGDCVCDDGYTGLGCETDIDECLCNPCQLARKCENLNGSYECSLPSFTQPVVEDGDEKLIIALAVACTGLALLVIVFVVMRHMHYRRRSSVKTRIDDTIDVSNEMFRMTDSGGGGFRRDYRDFESLQTTASTDFEAAGEEDVGRRSGGSTILRRNSSRSSTYKAPIPAVDGSPSPADVATTTFLGTSRFPNHHRANGRIVPVDVPDEPETESSAAPTIERAVTASRESFPPPPSDLGVLESPTPVTGSVRVAPSLTEAGSHSDVPAEVDDYMDRKLADLEAEDDRRLIPDELLHFEDEGILSEGASLSSLSIASESSEASGDFWERVRDFGPKFEKLADVMTEHSSTA
uniref:Cadherin 1 n=1 Tax=Oscarella pearsei TaxID=1940113 RepID=A0A3G2LGF3_OSCPE|nr:cadherin 1 [Oscarella pearsei]|eukprot:m.115621 g.115621  ORF g.115621 m.115621 type:complete len:5558 (+) comp37554_c0_seq1:291-16964(+)